MLLLLVAKVRQKSVLLEEGTHIDCESISITKRPDYNTSLQNEYVELHNARVHQGKHIFIHTSLMYHKFGLGTPIEHAARSYV